MRLSLRAAWNGLGAVIALGFLAPTANAQTWTSRPIWKAAPVPQAGPGPSDCGIDASTSGAVGDGVTDDTAAIQAVLAHGGRVCITRPGTYVVGASLVRAGVMPNATLNSALVIGSGTTLMLGRGVRLRMADHSDCYLMRNANPATGDHDITIAGGSFDGNCNNQHDNLWIQPYWFGHLMAFKNVQRIQVRDTGTIEPTCYAWLFAGCNDVTVERIGFRHYHRNSDGVHFDGPGERIVVRDISGVTADNMVSFTPDEGTYFFGKAIAEWGSGDIRDVLVENVHSNFAKEPVRLTGPAYLAMENFTIRNVTGSVRDGMGIHLHDDDLGLLSGCRMSNILIENISCVVPPGYAQVAIDASGARDVTVRDVWVRDRQNIAVLVESKPGSSVDLTSLRIENVRTTTPVERLVKIGGGNGPSRVRQLLGSNWTGTITSGGVMIDASQQIDAMTMKGVVCTGGIFVNKSVQTPSVMDISGLRLVNAEYGFICAGTTAIDLSNSSVDGAGTLVLYQADPRAVTRVTGSELAYGSPTPMSPVYVAGGLLRVSHPSWRMRGVSFTAPALRGDRFFNTETGVMPWALLGMGKVRFDGVQWVRE